MSNELAERIARELWNYYLDIDSDREESGEAAIAKGAEMVMRHLPQPAAWQGISFNALLAVLARLKSENRNPERQWYLGWNAALDCLTNDINARNSAPLPAPPVEPPRSG